MPKTGYTTLGANLRSDEVRLARHLMQQEGIGPTELVKRALLELANKHIGGVSDWDAYKIASVATVEREKSIQLEQQLHQAKVEIQALTALIPSGDHISDSYTTKTTVVSDDDPNPPEFLGLKMVELVS